MIKQLRTTIWIRLGEVSSGTLPGCPDTFKCSLGIYSRPNERLIRIWAYGKCLPTDTTTSSAPISKKMYQSLILSQNEKGYKL